MASNEPSRADLLFRWKRSWKRGMISLIWERRDARRMSELELITRRLCLIKDTGHAGVLWGGNMMAWVDEAGAIFAAQLAKNKFMVTKAFTEIDFKRQVRPGDFVEFWGK